jgi:hypothetical protein
VRAAWGLEGWARALSGLIVLTVSAFHEPRSTRAVAPPLTKARSAAAFQAHLSALMQLVDDREGWGMTRDPGRPWAARERHECRSANAIGKGYAP